MELYEVFYKAACEMSNLRGFFGDFSCNTVDRVAGHKSFGSYSPERKTYDSLMRKNPRRKLWLGDISDASYELGWSKKDYRTFMLLMASEAVK